MGWETRSAEYAIKQELLQQLFLQEGRDGEERAGKGKMGRLLRVWNFTRYIGYAKRRDARRSNVG